MSLSGLRWLRTLLFALVPLVMVLGLLEVVLRVTHLFGAYVSWTTPDPNVGFRYVLGDHDLFFREGNLTTRVHVNRGGWIAPEWSLQKRPGSVRIALLGDSFLEALQVERSQTASIVAQRLLQERLHSEVEVLAFGRSGFSQTEQLFLLQTEVMQFAPDVIVDFFFPGNDIADVRWSTTGDTLRPFYNVALDGALIFDNSFNRSPQYRFRVWIDPFKRRSALISLIVQDYNAVRRRGAATSQQYDVEKGYLSLCTSTPDANFQASYQLNRRLLESEAAFAKQHGIPFVLVTLDNPAYQPQVAEKLRRDAPTLDPNCIENDMEKVGDDSGAYHLGLQSVFAEAYAKDKIDLHWPLDGHWNAAGNRVAGEALAKTLEMVLQSRHQPPYISQRMVPAWRN
jgi:hypothetical protein